MLTTSPRVSRHGTCGTFVVETENSVYAFDIHSSSTGVRAIKGGSILDTLSDTTRGVGLDQLIYDTSVRRICQSCDVLHDSSDLSDIYVGHRFTFRVGDERISTSRVTKVYFA